MTSNPGGYRVRSLPVPSSSSKSPQLVSIDPGLSTGVAMFENGRLIRSLTTKAPHLKLERLLTELPEGTEVVAEQGPTNHRRQAEACAPVEALVRRLASNVHWVRPSTWKPHPSAQLSPLDEPATIHERDAIRMGRWYLARKGTSLGSTSQAA